MAGEEARIPDQRCGEHLGRSVAAMGRVTSVFGARRRWVARRADAKRGEVGSHAESVGTRDGRRSVPTTYYREAAVSGRELERTAVRVVASALRMRSQPVEVMRNSYWPPPMSCWVLPKRPPRSYWMVRWVLPTKVRMPPSASST